MISYTVHAVNGQPAFFKSTSGSVTFKNHIPSQNYRKALIKAPLTHYTRPRMRTPRSRDMRHFCEKMASFYKCEE